MPPSGRSAAGQVVKSGGLDRGTWAVAVEGGHCVCSYIFHQNPKDVRAWMCRVLLAVKSVHYRTSLDGFTRGRPPWCERTEDQESRDELCTYFRPLGF